MVGESRANGRKRAESEPNEGLGEHRHTVWDGAMVPRGGRGRASGAPMVLVGEYQKSEVQFGTGPLFAGACGFHSIQRVWNWFVLVASTLGFAQFGWISTRTRAWQDATLGRG